jgi:hypothetical protein
VFVADASAPPEGGTNEGIIKLKYCILLRSLYESIALKLAIICLIINIEIRGHIFSQASD